MPNLSNFFREHPNVATGTKVVLNALPVIALAAGFAGFRDYFYGENLEEMINKDPSFQNATNIINNNFSPEQAAALNDLAVASLKIVAKTFGAVGVMYAAVKVTEFLKSTAKDFIDHAIHNPPTGEEQPLLINNAPAATPTPTPT